MGMKVLLLLVFRVEIGHKINNFTLYTLCLNTKIFNYDVNLFAKFVNMIKKIFLLTYFTSSETNSEACDESTSIGSREGFGSATFSSCFAQKFDFLSTSGFPKLTPVKND